MSISEFFKRASKTDIADSLNEEQNRYSKPSALGILNPGRWWLIYQASKYEYLPRQSWMTRDKTKD